jgi:hypothetical protein
VPFAYLCVAQLHGIFNTWLRFPIIIEKPPVGGEGAVVVIVEITVQGYVLGGVRCVAFRPAR